MPTIATSTGPTTDPCFLSTEPFILSGVSVTCADIALYSPSGLDNACTRTRVLNNCPGLCLEECLDSADSPDGPYGPYG
jgi:hypothetical protein